MLTEYATASLAVSDDINSVATLSLAAWSQGTDRPVSMRVTGEFRPGVSSLVELAQTLAPVLTDSDLAIEALGWVSVDAVGFDLVTDNVAPKSPDDEDLLGELYLPRRGRCTSPSPLQLLAAPIHAG